MSNLPLATIGVFLLWLGWFGFNGGSVLSADPDLTSLTLVTTNIAASAGVLAGLFTAWVVFKRADISFALNGALAGLVGITASADSVTPMAALFIGLIAGIIVVFSVMMFDKLKVDDPVGAISVHLSCGIWGTLAVAIFGQFDDPDVGQFSDQIVGILAYGVAAFAFAFVVFLILKVTMGIRVSPEEEAEGLDKGEHHLIAYDMPEKLS
jgi:Amt family ammonium transporter